MSVLFVHLSHFCGGLLSGVARLYTPLIALIFRLVCTYPFSVYHSGSGCFMALFGHVPPSFL